MITSLSNPRVKYVKSLGNRKKRISEKKFVIEGIHLVSEALKVSGERGLFKIDFALFFKKIKSSKEGKRLLESLTSNGVETIEVPEKIMGDVSEVETPQGILAVVKLPDFDLAELVYSENPLALICVGIQDPGNLGALIRTADAVGCSGVVVSKGCADVYSGKVVRSTMGSIFHLPIVYVEDVKQALAKLEKMNFKLVAAALDGGSDFWSGDYRGLTAFVLGNEGSGLPKQVVDQCGEKVKIPMPGKAESLNVAMSGSILLYEALRQRNRGTASE
jgi:TrmH family RNA methyltransferase